MTKKETSGRKLPSRDKKLVLIGTSGSPDFMLPRDTDSKRFLLVTLPPRRS